MRGSLRSFEAWHSVVGDGERPAARTRRRFRQAQTGRRAVTPPPSPSLAYTRSRRQPRALRLCAPELAYGYRQNTRAIENTTQNRKDSVLLAS